jgi:hypothetical protein
MALADVASVPRRRRWERCVHEQQVAAVTRAGLFWLAGGLAVAGVLCLVWGISLTTKDIRSHLAGNYQEYSRDADGARYVCDGSPDRVAHEIAQF